MKLSFVIPAYNEQMLIAGCLSSILEVVKRHNYDAEVIVVNNASTDETGRIARSFPGVIVVDEPRKGLSQARQTGFEYATGDLIANVDADTLMSDEWVRVVLESFSQNSTLVALSGPHYFYDLPRTGRAVALMFYWLAYVNYLINKHVLRTASFLQGGNFVVTRKALEQVGGFNPAFTFYGEDTDIAKRLHKIGNVVFTFKLPLHASGRRIQHEGYIRMAFRYAINNWTTIFFGKAVTKHRRDVHGVFTPRRRHKILLLGIGLFIVAIVSASIFLFHISTPAEAKEHPYLTEKIELIKARSQEIKQKIYEYYQSSLHD